MAWEPTSELTWRRCFAFLDTVTLKRPIAHYLTAIFLVAIFLRLPWLGLKSLWLDEVLSANFATPVMADVDFIHPPLYYVIVHYALSLLGRSEFALRLPSALFSLANVGLVYVLGSKLINRRAGLMAAALLAVSPLDIWYGQEARNYAAVAFMALLMTLGLAWRSPAGFLLYFAGLVAGLHLHYVFAPLWIAVSAVWLVTWWQQNRKPLHLALWLVTTGAAWWIFRPWLADFLAGRWLILPVRSLFGVSDLASVHFIVGALGLTAASAAGAILAPRLLRTWRWRRWATILVLAVFASYVLFVPVPRAYALKRVTYTGWALLVLFVAWLVLELPRYRRLALGLLLGLSLASSLIAVFVVPKDDWRGVARTLQARDPQAAVWVDPNWNRLAINYYRPQQPALYGSLDELEVAAEEYERLWFIAERFHGRPVPSSPSEAWLDENMDLLEAIPFYRLELRHYGNAP